MLPPFFTEKQTQGARDEQQDCVRNLIVGEHTTLHILADGMGGHRNGSLAAETAAKAFSDHVEAHGASAQPEALLKQALYAANNAIARIITVRPETEGMGTTLLALLLNRQSGAYSFVSVGDSPLYVFDDASGLRRINANHAFAADLEKLVRAGQISREEAEQHPSRHAITSAVMGRDIPRIDLQSGMLLPDALLLMASDGLQTLNDAPEGEMAALLERYAADLDDCGTKLLAAVRDKDKPGQDNASLILIRRPPAVRTVANPITRNNKKRGSTAARAQRAAAAQPEKNAVSWVPVLAGMALAAVVVAGVLLFLFAAEKGGSAQPNAAPPAAASAVSAPLPASAPPPAPTASAPASAAAVPLAGSEASAPAAASAVSASQTD
ncbi:PP2C family protein-serine/threonine phosphatase [Conchiformibius kuhniae]|uniref:PP2C family protein-serine/threonine phosphatase n=1 Tax=Conchiformibius kuhniae TaxID=211502 RepID=A0A8T9MY12_9NEIS|nr:protein phosphatase 2C domain-containing protein [Conchiformibius kuhniae]UOP05092.1 protein phosphatase 2C domain-containing protein [Conchiformibius kuhniae]